MGRFGDKIFRDPKCMQIDSDPASERVLKNILKGKLNNNLITVVKM